MCINVELLIRVATCNSNSPSCFLWSQEMSVVQGENGMIDDEVDLQDIKSLV